MKNKKYLFLLLSCLLVGCIADCFIPRPCIKRQGASIQTIYYQPSQEEGRRPVLTAEQEQSVLDILADSRRQQTLIAPPGGMGDYLYVAVDTQEGQIQVHLFDSGGYIVREGRKFCDRLLEETQVYERLQEILLQNETEHDEGKAA